MEEKKSLKMSLSTFLLIISIIVISIMGFYIYQITVSRTNIQNNVISNNVPIINNEALVLQDENAKKMAEKTLTEYIKFIPYENSNIGPMPYILVELGLETEENINLLCEGITDSSTYIKSNTKYEDFEESLLQYITKKYFIENFSQYKNLDGYVGFCNCAATSTPITIENIVFTSKNIDKYIFDVTFKDLLVYEHYLNPGEGEEISENDYLFTETITFEYANNNLLISNYADSTNDFENPTDNTVN